MSKYRMAAHPAPACFVVLVTAAAQRVVAMIAAVGVATLILAERARAAWDSDRRPAGI